MLRYLYVIYVVFYVPVTLEILLCCTYIQPINTWCWFLQTMDKYFNYLVLV